MSGPTAAPAKELLRLCFVSDLQPMGFPTVSLAFASHRSRGRISSRTRSSRRELCKRFASP
eukprot:4245233-Pyramimonas_sp.AAC.1